MKRKSSRREFLQGRSAAEVMAEAIRQALPDGHLPGGVERTVGDAYLIRVSRRAMACEFEVCFSAGQYAHATETALEALDLVQALEDQMSVFKPTSEICQINRRAALEPVEVEPALFALLELAVQLHGQTSGAFDVTCAPLWEAWGFARRQGAVPDRQRLAEARRLVGSKLLELDAAKKTVRFLRPGVQLNLGGIGKGHALDRAAERLSQAGIADFLIHGGHSSVLARGYPAARQGKSSKDPADGWTVGVRHPLQPDRRLTQLQLRDQALATSGSGAQSFVHEGRCYGHILDPRTGRPAEGVLLATAIAPNAALADALSTAFYVMGPQATREYCQGRPEIAALLVCPTPDGSGIRIETVAAGPT
jgi:thiamine biosynthesis lipoprotein